MEGEQPQGVRIHSQREEVLGQCLDLKVSLQRVPDLEERMSS